MSISDDFYLHFPSFNANSKENIRNRRITQDCLNFITQNQKKSPSPKKTSRIQHYKHRRSQISDNVITTRQHYHQQPLQSPLEEIFSVEERNQIENQKKLEQKKIYQQVLEMQIIEQQRKKEKEKEKLRQEELIFEERYNRQIQQQIQELRHNKPAEKVVERISMSENEKERYNQDRYNSSMSEPLNNKVYRYFSQSASKDSELFNYKKLFDDIINDYRHDFKHKPMPLRKSSSEGKLSTSNNAECTRCHKKLDMFCDDCNIWSSMSRKPATNTNQLQIEYNEQDLPISKQQQVVIYRPSDQHMPYSFNIAKDSNFYPQTTTTSKTANKTEESLADMKKYSDQKMANYMKNYGSLRRNRKTTSTSTLLKDEKKSITKTGTIPKDKLSLSKQPQNNQQENKLKYKLKSKDDNATVVSELDDIFNRAQITTITQTGLVRKHLANDENYEHFARENPQP